jgi:hypothetical protein
MLAMAAVFTQPARQALLFLLAVGEKEGGADCRSLAAELYAPAAGALDAVGAPPAPPQDASNETIVDYVIAAVPVSKHAELASEAIKAATKYEKTYVPPPRPPSGGRATRTAGRACSCTRAGTASASTGWRVTRQP